MLKTTKTYWIAAALAVLIAPGCQVADSDDDDGDPVGQGNDDDEAEDAGADDDSGDDDEAAADDDQAGDDDSQYFDLDSGADDDSGDDDTADDAGPWAGDAGPTGGDAGPAEGDAGPAEGDAGEQWDEEAISDELEIPEYPDEDLRDETVGGIDEDTDGVRDDVERDLAVKYWPDRKLIDVINELVQDDNQMITNPDDADIVTDSLERKKLALGCLELHFEGDLLRALEITGDIAAHVLDTPERMAAARAVDEKLGGQVITLPTDPEVERFCQGLWTPELAVDAAEAAAENTNAACRVNSKTVTVYSNGMFERHDKAILNGMALRQRVKTNAAANTNFVYRLAYNDHAAVYAAAGSTDDYGTFETVADLIDNSPEWMEAFNRHQSGPASLPQWLDASLQASGVFADQAALVEAGDIQSQAAAFSSDGTVGNRVFLVGHGLGAVAANAAHATVIGQLPDLAGSVHVIGVGTPADAIAGDANATRYVTLESDQVVTQTMVSEGVTALPPNAVNATAGDPSGHEFLQSYVRGDGAGPALQALLDSAIADVDAPEAIATDGIITVTLTWGEQPDVDLHAFEPSGVHVFYQRLQGDSGELDLDDTSSFGPEHYTVSCASLVEGTYGIGLNYFRGTAPETATVNIQAGGQSRTFTVELPTALSSGGNDTPVMVADIVVTAGEEANTFVFQIVAAE